VFGCGLCFESCLFGGRRFGFEAFLFGCGFCFEPGVFGGRDSFGFGAGVLFGVEASALPAPRRSRVWAPRQLRLRRGRVVRLRSVLFGCSFFEPGVRRRLLSVSVSARARCSGFEALAFGCCRSASSRDCSAFSAGRLRRPGPDPGRWPQRLGFALDTGAFRRFRLHRSRSASASVSRRSAGRLRGGAPRGPPASARASSSV
jgi:hypothetical protein